MVSGAEARAGGARAGGASEAEAQAERTSLRRMTRERLRDLRLRPSRERGQNFLVDARYLDVVVSAAELSTADVVLEVGGGLGVLSEQVAPRVRHLHVVEIDPRLAPALEDALAPFSNASLHLADAVRLDPGGLTPVPGKLVANLPYGVAATVVLRSLEELPALTLAVVMVQREVAERLAAAPGSRTYGATSVLAQLACDVRVARRVPASAFHPAPNVESAIVVLRRTRAAPPAAIRALVRDAFAHRRKTLAGSLALAPRAGDRVRDRAREALASLGHPPNVRAERLSPSDFERLADLLAPAEIAPPAATRPGHARRSRTGAHDPNR